MRQPPEAPFLTADPTALLGDLGALRALADRAGALVLRTELSRPGFCLIDLGPAFEPLPFRRLLIGLGRALDDYYRRHTGRRLVFLSVSRFDQQASTRPHRDGGPDESVLLLGYEPTEVVSRVSLLDYTRCAADRGLTPQEFLARHNPAYAAGQELLRDYTTEVTPFRVGHYQVLLVNNSCTPVEARERGMLGVLHQAVLPEALPGRSRWIDSLMLTTAGPGEAAGLGDEEVRAFVEQAAAAAR
jgi:hypothetical protein